MINNRFEILRKLGKGRSQVFLCTDKFYNKNFAMKVLPANMEQEEKEMFRNEFYILSNFNSKNIIKSYEINVILEIDNSEDSEFGISLGSEFIIIEYIEGTPLLQYSKLSNEHILRDILKQICSVLYYLHQSNYIYYDLKPDNILVQEINGIPTIKFIDFGFTVFYPEMEKVDIRGTAEFIAPELLKKEFVDHRCDLYSLGILLYRILYNQFPFDSSDELDIYKAHISQDFTFSKSKYSDKLISITKKLLEKDPSERYNTTLEILHELNIPLDQSIVSEWIGAKCFSNEASALSAIDMYLLSENEGNVLTLRGTSGSGKTALLKQIEVNADNAVRIKNYPNTSKFDYWKILIHQLLYHKNIYKNIDYETRLEISKFLAAEHPNLIERLKAIFIKLTVHGNFIVLIDNINNIDDFSLLILRQLIQVLQINNVKVILTENSDKTYFSPQINNCQIFNLTAFSKDEADLYLERSYSSFFPKNEALKLIIKYADLLPGSIISFIRDLIALEILEFSSDSPSITENSEKLALLETYQDEIFRLRTQKLDAEEIKVANILSLLESKINRTDLAPLTGLKVELFDSYLKSLSDKNIIASESISISPVFISEGLKKYIYNNIDDKEKLHAKTASRLRKYTKEIHSYELGKQYELAKDFEQSFKYFSAEIEKAQKISAYTYQQKLLEHVLTLPINDKQKFKVSYELCGVLLTLDNLNSCLDQIEDTLILVNSFHERMEVEIIKGICLIKLGKHNEGILILDKNIESLKDVEKKNDLKTEIASAEFDLGNYDNAKKIVEEIINETDSSAESIGRCYTILGLLEIYVHDKLENAIVEFNNALHVFKKAELISRQAGIELNLGNIYSMIGETTKAEQHWERAVELNLSVGNFEQEAFIQLNYGIYNFNKQDYEKAVLLYKRSLNIFKTTGNQNGEGLALSNMGEVYTASCEYQLAIDSLEKAESIFMKTRNIEEEIYTIFLIGKLYFIIGMIDELRSVFNSLESLIARTSTTPKLEQYLKFQEQLLLLLDPVKSPSQKELKNLQKLYEASAEANEYAFITLQITYNHLRHKEFNKAEEELNLEYFQKVCKQNKLIFAEREFILGLIASENNNIELLPSIEHYEKALYYLENESITELTWKVNFHIASYYFDRGNLNKAKDYIYYSKSLLEFISSEIKNLKIRNAYLTGRDRNFALETLEKFENKYQ